MGSALDACSDLPAMLAFVLALPVQQFRIIHLFVTRQKGGIGEKEKEGHPPNSVPVPVLRNLPLVQILRPPDGSAVPDHH